MLRVGIVAGEPSGDQLGAALITALRARGPVEIRAMAGPRMRAAGCTELAGIEELSVMGVVEVLRHYPRLRRLRSRLLGEFLRWRPDVFVGIDVPDFTLHLEARLKATGIAAVHYACPQVWAWRRGRVRMIRRATDLVLTLFPFEAPFLREYGVPAEFVGHPLADRIPLAIDRATARAQLALAPGGPVVALLPGSRRQEYTRHLPLFLATARALRASLPEIQFVLGAVNEHAARAMQTGLAGEDGVDCRVISGRTVDILSAADVALCVSGTVTLEAALTKTPLVVAYQLSPLSYQILKRMVHSRWIALPNLLLGRDAVPEFVQDRATPSALAAALLTWLQEPLRRAEYTQACLDLHRELRNNAGAAAASAILALAAKDGGPGGAR